jgi:hypothetical protein
LSRLSEGENSFTVKDLYTLNNDHFEMALQILSEWRLAEPTAH